jgi:DNA-binding GntR family transcriptional regulator
MRSVRQERAKGTAKAPTAGGRPGELFEPINHSTMHERVYEQIRDAFASGKVVPGQRIVIREFARSFGTSMMPIRDSLRRLEAENAVVTTTGRNLAVPIMTASDYEELCLIRVSLEGLAASEAAKTITKAQIEEASEFAGGMEDAFDSRDAEGTMHFNRKFHFSVYAGAHRPLLLKMIESLWLRVGPQLAFAIRHDIHGGEVVRSPYHPHRQTLAALRARDARSASLAIAYDISRAGQIIAEYLRKTKDDALPHARTSRRKNGKENRT